MHRLLMLLQLLYLLSLVGNGGCELRMNDAEETTNSISKSELQYSRREDTAPKTVAKHARVPLSLTKKIEITRALQSNFGGTIKTVYICTESRYLSKYIEGKDVPCKEKMLNHDHERGMTSGLVVRFHAS